MNVSHSSGSAHGVPWTLALIGLAIIVLALAREVSVSAAALPTAPDKLDCIDDSDGANDEPGQKDLTRWCTGKATANTLEIAWNWDITKTSGANTADGCALFDTDSDGLVNYAVCHAWNGDPPAAIPDYPVVYACGDKRPFNCAGAVQQSPIKTTCTVAVAADDPFPAGDSAPNDAKATCSINLADVGGASATLLDVCSYPSSSPTSDASDCVRISEVKANVNVLKDVYPDDESTGWDITVTGPTAFTDSFTGDDSTGIKTVAPGAYLVQEGAAASTSFDGYVASWSCNLDGDAVDSGTGTTTSSLSAVAGKVLSCTFTNRRPSIAIKKYTSADGINFHDSDTCIQWTDPAGPDYCVPIPKGAPVHWKYEITNDGQVDLTGLGLTDDRLVTPTFTCSPVDLGQTLPAGASTTCTASDATVGSGLYANIGTASGTATGTNGNPLLVDRSDASHYYGYSATITVEKVTQPAGDDQVFNFELRDESGGVVKAPLTDLTANPFTRSAQQAPVAMQVIPGTYQLSEVDPYINQPSDWQLVNLLCSKGGSSLGTWTGNPSVVIAGLQVDNGETVSCTFINRAPGPTAVSISALSATRTGDLPYAAGLALAAVALAALLYSKRD